MNEEQRSTKIIDAIELKQKIEKEILTRFQSFESKTGLSVHSIDIQRAETTGLHTELVRTYRTIGVSLEVNL